MIRQTVVHPHFEILLNNEKEQITDTHNNVDESHIHNAE